MTKRVLVVVAVAAAIAVVAAYLLRPERGVPDDAPTLDAMAHVAGADVMRHLYRGHVPGRSGEIMLVPRPHNFIIGDWDLTTLGSDTPTLSTSHPNPWDYLARVPIVVYGPGYVEAGETVQEPVDIAALAPTYARVLGIDMPTDAAPLTGVRANGEPRVIFTVVIDGGGWNALREHPDSHPVIDSLRERGVTYTNATIGSAPSITGALHATFGTGVYPLTHGIPGNQMRGPDGENTDTWLENADPRYLESPTVAELWDEANGNRPVVATVSYEGWHLGMIGAGAGRDGGDKDIAVLWDTLESSWWINEDFYELPDYLDAAHAARLDDYEEELDRRDTLRDGTWFGHTLEELRAEKAEVGATIRPGTPAFVRLTGDAVIDVMRNERVGRDGIADMVWIEMKMPDYAGHAWNVTSPEEADVLRETDRQIGRMVAELDRTVGKGNYLFAVSADHGQEPLPDLTGGWRINSNELERDIEDRFGSVIEKVTPVDIYVDADALEDEGATTEDIARYIATYTIGENIPEGAPGEDNVPEARLTETLFAGAFDSDYLAALDEVTIEDFGLGEYCEGQLTRPPGECLTQNAIP